MCFQVLLFLFRSLVKNFPSVTGDQLLVCHKGVYKNHLSFPFPLHYCLYFQALPKWPCFQWQSLCEWSFCLCITCHSCPREPWACPQYWKRGSLYGAGIPSNRWPQNHSKHEVLGQGSPESNFSCVILLLIMLIEIDSWVTSHQALKISQGEAVQREKSFSSSF